jgi:EPS-associated MarR family transcriptional regulator
MINVTPVILCGGSGTRLWPLSRTGFPKQFLCLKENPDLTQRELADKLGMSVGGLNYCLNALIDKGFVKMKNFANSKNKFGYIYVLTPIGMAGKVALTYQFLQRRMNEYEELKVEIESLLKNQP